MALGRQINIAIAKPILAMANDLGANGLTQSEATQRLCQYGYNELPEKKENPFLKFLGYFWGPIPWMIEAAVVLSGTR